MQPKIIVLFKYPRPGRVKTRLVPALGEQRACELFEHLVRHTLGEVERFATAGKISVELRIADPPNELELRRWIGERFPFRRQSEGDLGQRLEEAAKLSFERGDNPMGIIAGECPEPTRSHLD